jgi:60 kDa SS-A/Ro ribonucleoprotein
MANAQLFSSHRGPAMPAADEVNEAGGRAYARSPRQALAQYAATGCLSDSYYAGAEEQLDRVLDLASQVEPDFVAQTAVFARERGYMKDMPALLLAVLSVRGPELLEATFERVVDNGRMLRNFVQIMRSGVVGRKSLGSRPKRLVRRWLDARRDEDVFRASVGESPSIADVIRMVHPRPATRSRAALYAWLLGRPYDAGDLPEIVRRYEDYKAGRSHEVPPVPFQMLTSFRLDADAWRRIAERATWQQTRMNLRTFARHGLFRDEPTWRTRMVRRLLGGTDRVSGLADRLADRLRDPELIRRARVFPYQLLIAWKTVGKSVPAVLRRALEEAMEVAIDNVPSFQGRTVVCPDVSGSMTYSAVTGWRWGATSKVRCVDVAALVAAAVLRKNPEALVLPFEHRVHTVRLEPDRGVMWNAERLSRIGGGGTNCSAPLRLLNDNRVPADLVLIVSDNESWVDWTKGHATAVMAEWGRIKVRNPRARLVCLDIQPYRTVQATDRDDILNIGGFSDRVFDLIADFAAGRLAAGHWVEVIEKIELSTPVRNYGDAPRAPKRPGSKA